MKNIPVFILTDNPRAFRTDYSHIDPKSVIFIHQFEQIFGIAEGLILVKSYSGVPDRVFDELEFKVLQRARAKGISYIDL